jgi:chitinase
MKKIFLKRRLLFVCVSTLAIPMSSHAAGRYYSSNVKPVNLTKLSCSAGKGYMSIVYQNLSKEAVDLDALQISYPSLNALKPTQLSVTGGSAPSTAPSTSYKDGIEKIIPNLTGTVPKWQILTVYVGDNSLKSNLDANICNNLTLSYGNVTTGIIDIHNNTSKPKGAQVDNPTVEINKNDGSKFGTYPVPWDSSFEVKNIAPGKYTVVASTYDIGDLAYTPSIVPESAINIMKGKTTNVSITYKPSTLPGFMSLTAEKPSGFPSDEKKPIITLKDQEHSNLERMQAISQWGETKIRGLKPRDKYELSTGSIFVKENSNNCTPTFTPDIITASSLEEEGFKSRLSYTCKAVETVTGKITITGAPKEQSRVTIHFKPENDIYPVIDEEIPLQDGKGTITKVPGFIVDQTYKVSIDDISRYTPLFNPSIIKPVAGKTVNETIKYSKANKLMAGYFMPLHPFATPHYFDLAARHGYNLALESFGTITAVSSGTYSIGSQYGRTRQEIKTDIGLAKTHGLKTALLSFSYQGNPSIFEVGKPTLANINGIAIAIANYLKAGDLDGVDFDIEYPISNLGWTPANLDQLMKAIQTVGSKTLGRHVVITCAPQLFYKGSSSSPTSYILVSQGQNEDFNTAIENGDFDYIIVQEALSFPAEIDPSIISKSYHWLVGSSKKTDLNIPAKTKLLFDVLSGPNVKPDNPNTVWHKCQGDCSNVFNQLASQYKSLTGQAQFGGAATWSTNQDQGNGWKWAKNIGPSINSHTVPKNHTN